MPKDMKLPLPLPTAEASFTEAFERLRPRLVAMVERRIDRKLSVRLDPEGVVQEAYLRAWPRWRSLSPRPRDLDIWLYGQVRDRLIEMMRSALGPEGNVNRETCCATDAASPLADVLIDSETGASTALSRAERREVVQAALEKLDHMDREILTLRYIDSLSFVQIGEILGLRENTANARALRALVKFRKLIPPAFRPTRASQA